MALSHNKAAAEFLQTGVMAETPTIEVDDIKQELGPYLSQGNNIDVLQQLYQGFSTSKFLNWKRAVTEYKATISEAVDHVVQQFSKDWTPKSGAKFKPLTIKNYHHKVDFAIVPSEVGESWLFSLYDEGKTPDQMPITRYIIDKVLLPKITDDIEMVMIGKAKFVDGSKKTEEVMDGIETQLVEERKHAKGHVDFRHGQRPAESIQQRGTGHHRRVRRVYGAAVQDAENARVPVGRRVPQVQVCVQGEVGRRLRNGENPLRRRSRRLLELLPPSARLPAWLADRLLHAPGKPHWLATQESAAVHLGHSETRPRGSRVHRILARRRIPAWRSRLRHRSERLRSQSQHLVRPRGRTRQMASQAHCQ